ncbi:MAG: class I SAM-dependent methyltransferase [Candidatus Hodarchaeales archaeon]|jgi:ubiquinone/menaquinone biosynthesis C-methylase UbiE
MAHSHQEHFENPSRFFLWGYRIANIFHGRNYYGKIVEELNLSGNESVLEFGSGMGFLAKRLAKKLNKDGQLTCIDISEAMIQQTKKRLRRFDNVKIIKGDLRNIDLEEESYDYIISTWVIHHIVPDALRETIEKLTSLLRPNGKILIIEFPDSDTNHSDVSQKELIGYFAKSGFKNEIIYSKNHGILYEFAKR